MTDIIFQFLNKSDCGAELIKLFDILHGNMSVIAPTGESYEEDKKLWISSITDVLNNPDRNIILIIRKSEIIGFFMYSISGDIFRMEEIQLKSDYHGIGIFNSLYRYVFDFIPDNVKFVEVFSNKQNIKSQTILSHLGLEVVGENKNGRCYRYYGLYMDLKDVIMNENAGENQK